MGSKLDYLLYKTSGGKRKIAKIHEYGFYQSTGSNSGYKDTWFPFLGIVDPSSKSPFMQQIANVTAQKKGYIVKAGVKYRDIPENIEKKGYSLGLNEEFFERMGSMECLLISSLTNQGFWATNEGKDFKNILKQNLTPQFANFYQKHDDITFAEKPAKKTNATQPEVVNSWIGSTKEIAMGKKQEDITPQDRKRQFNAKFQAMKEKKQGPQTHLQNEATPTEKPVLQYTQAKAEHKDDPTKKRKEIK